MPAPFTARKCRMGSSYPTVVNGSPRLALGPYAPAPVLSNRLQTLSIASDANSRPPNRPSAGQDDPLHGLSGRAITTPPHFRDWPTHAASHSDDVRLTTLVGGAARRPWLAPNVRPVAHTHTHTTAYRSYQTLSQQSSSLPRRMCSSSSLCERPRTHSTCCIGMPFLEWFI